MARPKKTTIASRSARSGAKGKASTSGAVPDVYREMLADAVTSSPTHTSDEGRAVKRRRVGGKIVTKDNEDLESHKIDQSNHAAQDSDLDELFEDVKPNQQHILESDSVDSANSDFNWEEVDLEIDHQQADAEKQEDPEDGQLHIVLRDDDNKQNFQRLGKAKRKPIKSEEKKLRLAIHKMHICSLLAHAHLRNHWCDDETVYKYMRKLLPQKTISYLNPDESKSQFQRSRSFMDGLEQASEVFRGNFKVTLRGMGKSRWADSPETLSLLQPPDDIELPMQRSDFRDTAHSLRSSRDTGAQLFCAMLRSAGADARLVCSLQPLPFQPAQTVDLSQIKPRANTKFGQRSREMTPKDESATGTASDASIHPASPQPPPSKVAHATRKRRKPIRESKYPIYWVEAFNEAVLKWVPIDPIVTKSIAKPSKFEPPAGESDNNMSYVIAFEDDGCARDVTRRYVKAYNAKTRRYRVESSDGGDRWWRRVLKMYRASHSLDREQVEDAELAAKEAAEPMPRNVQDFRDHPYYALERHLKRHEVIHPKREVGKVGAGRANDALEPIYRRRDVYIVKSADKWYRLGREIRTGEQPLKRVPVRRNRDQSLDPEELDEADEDNAGTALYAAYQTTLYSAPPFKNGRIPKNVYGNLDVYVSSMVPPGGCHMKHPEVVKAARILGIDYADAVTGFHFKGRHGTAVTNGAVVAVEYAEAVEEVIRAFEDDRAKAEEERRSSEALRMWKRMLAGLRIRERIEGYDIEGEDHDAVKKEMEKVDEDEDEDEGGGFLPDRDAEESAQPNAGRMAPLVLRDYGDFGGGGFSTDNIDHTPTTAIAVSPPRPGVSSIKDLEDDGGGGGGFLVDGDDADAEEELKQNRNRDRHPVSDQGVGFMPANDNLLVGGSALLNDITNDFVKADLTGEAKGNKAEESAMQLDAPSNTTTEYMIGDLGSDHAAPRLPGEGLEEAALIQRLHESGDIAHSTAVETKGTMSSPTAQETWPVYEDSRPNSSPLVGKASPPNQNDITMTNAIIDDEPADAEGSESEKGSLLSHDPEDEDAEPEWLT